MNDSLAFSDTRKLGERVTYIDIMRGICIILVILGHADFANSNIKPWIYAFHMPCFFFVTGLTFNFRRFSTWDDCKKYISKKFQSLIIPYFLWALIYSKLEPSNLLAILYGSHDSLINADSLSSLWFLPVMFIAVSFFSIMSKMCFVNLNKKLSGVLFIITIALLFVIGRALPSFSIGYPWGVNIAFYSTGFIMLGALLRGIFDRIDKLGVYIKFFMLFIFALGTCSYIINIPDLGYISMASEAYGSPILFVFFLASCIGNCYKINSIISKIGKSSMSIFLIHKPVLYLFSAGLSFISMPCIIELIIATVCTLIICFMAKYFISRYAPVLFGETL